MNELENEKCSFNTVDYPFSHLKFSIRRILNIFLSKGKNENLITNFYTSSILIINTLSYKIHHLTNLITYILSIKEEQKKKGK